jgi:hypothetical protein
MTTLMLETGLITDVLGVKIIGKGDPKCADKGEWNDPGNTHQCLSACSKLHKTRGQIVKYFAQCCDCISLYKADVICGGCAKHGANMCSYNNGNPRTDYGMAQSFLRCKKFLSEHSVRG